MGCPPMWVWQVRCGICVSWSCLIMGFQAPSADLGAAGRYTARRSTGRKRREPPPATAEAPGQVLDEQLLRDLLRQVPLHRRLVPGVELLLHPEGVDRPAIVPPGQIGGKQCDQTPAPPAHPHRVPELRR